MAACAGVDTNILECEGGGTAGIWHVISLVAETLALGLGVLGFIGILVFGIQYLTARGDVEKTTKAKKRLLQVVVGLSAWAVLYALTLWIMPNARFEAPDDITDITLSLDQNSLEVGQLTTFSVTISPSTATDRSYSMSSEQPDIAFESGGGVRCKSVGTATIVVTSVNNKKGSATITCTPPSNPDPDNSSGGNTGSNQSGTAYNKNDFISAYDSMDTPSYDEVRALARQVYGNEIDDNDFIAIMAWTRNENYWEHDKYYNYLCSCAMINKALAGEDVYRQVNGGYEGYEGVAYYGTEQFLESGSGYMRQANDAALKTAYLAFKNLDTRPYAAHGIVNENGYSYYGNWGSTVQRTSEAFYCTKTLDGTVVCAWDSSAGWYQE